MSSCFTRRLAKLNHQTRQVMAELQTWSPERLRFRPSGEAWSALDVLEHLRLTEAAVVATMQHNLPDKNRATIQDYVLGARILGVMFLPARVKVPGAVKSILPTTKERDLSALRQAWEFDRTKLASFLESLSVVDQQKGVFRHPFGGWATANGALLFLRSHLHHHRYQLARLRRASKDLATRCTG
jgi:hypothetical protein